MAVTQAQIDNLEAALAQGVLSVRYDDHEVTFASFEDMERRLAYLRRQLAGGAATGYRVAATSKMGGGS